MERVDYLLTAMEPCTKPAYCLVLALVQSQRNKGDETISYYSFEQDFITVDEKEEQISKKNQISAQGLTAETKHAQKPAAKANIASDTAPSHKTYTQPRDMSKVDCYNCGKSGHFSRDCRLPRKDKKTFNNGGASCSDCNRKRGHGNGRSKQNASLATEGT
jgi:hypothetical protein